MRQSMLYTLEWCLAIVLGLGGLYLVARVAAHLLLWGW